VLVKRVSGRIETLEDQSLPYLRTTPYPRSDIVLSPGDILETHCWYDNPNLYSVPFGEKSSDENCFAFVTAWPAGSLTVNPEALDPLRAFSLTERASRRCLDPFGILGSCSGLADSPY